MINPRPGEDPCLSRRGRPRYNQADKVVDRLGGPERAARLLGMLPESILRWRYSYPWGSDGIVPAPAVRRILKFARLEGIYIHPEDWVPEEYDYRFPWERGPIQSRVVKRALRRWGKARGHVYPQRRKPEARPVEKNYVLGRARLKKFREKNIKFRPKKKELP